MSCEFLFFILPATVNQIVQLIKCTIWFSSPQRIISKLSQANMFEDTTKILLFLKQASTWKPTCCYYYYYFNKCLDYLSS